MEYIDKWQLALSALANKDKAAILQRFFKTGPGEYGEGDIFAGIAVPDCRKVSKQMLDAPMEAVEEMLSSPIHEYRLSGLLVIVERYKRAKRPAEMEMLVDFYLSHTKYINNWDLVDVTCPHIIGAEVYRTENPEVLIKLSQSENLWEQRIGVVANWYLIRKGVFEPALEIIENLLYHQHDLIRKANGWMLREIGKRDVATLELFLDKYAATMPRITLSYATEKFDLPTRRHYQSLGKKVQKK